jgi:hypothetical protein
MIKHLRKIVYGKEYKDELDNKILNNKILWFMMMIMIFWNSMLSISYMDVKKNNIVKATFPPYEFNKEEQVLGNDFADDNHFLSWAMFYISTTSNFDTNSIQKKFDFLSNNMLLDDYLSKKENFNDFIENVKKNKLKSKFSSYNETWKVLSKENNKHDVEAATINVKGEVTNKYSSFEPVRKECEYTIILFRKDGATHVEDFGTTCF